MLLQRILTAVPLAILVVWMILFQPSDVFVYLLYLIATISGYEWARLCGMLPPMLRVLYALSILMVAVVFVEGGSEMYEAVLWLSLVWWCTV